MDKHDTVYKLLFSHDRMVRDLLVGFLPGKWTTDLDLDSLEKMNGSYVTDDLRGRRSSTFGKVAGGSGTSRFAPVLPGMAAPQATAMVPRRNLP